MRIAHRGASRCAPENTLAAFEAAIRQGVDAIELDVRLTEDGVPVVLHDDTLDRTTDGQGPVDALSYQLLRRLDAGAWFGSAFRGERVPTLTEALECARGRCGVNVEIKVDRKRSRRGRARPARRHQEAPLAQAIAAAVRRTEFSD